MTEINNNSSGFRRKIHGLKFFEFKKPVAFDLTFDEKDFFTSSDKQKQTLYLGRYTKEQIKQMLTDLKILNKLSNEKEFGELIIDVEIIEGTEHILRIFYQKKNKENLLVYLKLREGLFSFRNEFASDKPLEILNLLMVDWLNIQDPREKVKPSALFPGQEYPGLRMLRDMHEFIVILAKDLVREGVMATPEFFHVGLLYMEKMKFYDPYMQGQMLAIIRDFKKQNLHKVAWAVHTECVKNVNTNKYYLWEPSEMIEPLFPHIKEYYNSKQYSKCVEESFNSYKFKIDNSKLKTVMANLMEYED